MLIVMRKVGEAIVLNGVVTVRILEASDAVVKRVKFGIEAPPDVIVLREELLGISSDLVPMPARNGGESSG